jgi:hypothetical protein
MMLECQADGPRRNQQHQARTDKTVALARQQARQVAQHGSGQCQGEGNQPHPTQRREAGEWAVQLAVAGVQPWETGQEPATKRFLANPQRSKRQRIGQRRFITTQPACP